MKSLLWKNRKRRSLFFLALLGLLIFPILLGVAGNLRLFKSSTAMGPPNCPPDEYDSSFVNATISTGFQNINLLTHPGITFTALATEGYTISLIVRTANETTSGSTVTNGSTWLGTDSYGYASGSCQWSNVGPNENLSLVEHFNTCNCDPNMSPLEADWETNGVAPNEIIYRVLWVEPTTLSLNCLTNNGSATCNSTVSTHDPDGATVNAPTGNITFVTSTSAIGSCALEGVSDYSSCSITFTPGVSGWMSLAAFYSGDEYDVSSGNGTTFYCCPTLPNTTSSISSTSSVSSSSTTSSSSSSTSSTTETSSESSSSSTPPGFGTLVKTPSGQLTELHITSDLNSSEMTGISLSNDVANNSYSLFFGLKVSQGTVGTMTISIPYSAVPSGYTPLVYLNGTIALGQSFYEGQDSYYVTFMPYSTSQVMIKFTNSSSATTHFNTSSTPGLTTNNDMPETIVGEIVAGVVIVAGASMFIIKKKVL